MNFRSLFDRKERLINLEKSISLFKSYDLVGFLSNSEEERKDLLIGSIHLDARLVRTLISEIDEEITIQYSNQSDSEKAETRKWIDQRIDATNEEIDNLSSIEAPLKRSQTAQELLTRIVMFEDYQSIFSSKQR